MPRFQCAFPYENGNQPRCSRRRTSGNGTCRKTRARIETVYEFEARNAEQLYKWLEMRGAPIRSICDIKLVEREASS